MHVERMVRVRGSEITAAQYKIGFSVERTAPGNDCGIQSDKTYYVHTAQPKTRTVLM